MAEFVEAFAQAGANAERYKRDLEAERAKLGKGSDVKNSTEDAYKRRPDQQSYRTQKRGGDRDEDGYAPRGRGNRNDYKRGGRGGYKGQDEGADGEERGNYRGRSRGGYKKPRQGEEGAEGDENNGQVRTRGRGGYEGRGGRGGYRGDRGAPRGSQSRGGYRGGERGAYRGQRNYGRGDQDPRLSDDDSEDGDVLTDEQQKFIADVTSKHADKLKGLVRKDQIGRRCIDLGFDEAKVEAWVKQLTEVDKRVSGLKDFNWNDTVTRKDKAAARVQEAQ